MTSSAPCATRRCGAGARGLPRHPGTRSRFLRGRVPADSADAKAYARRLTQRITGLAASNSLLTSGKWQGVELTTLVRSQLAPFVVDLDRRVVVKGPLLRLVPAAAQALGMALHELATNAAKYGALSNDTGTVAVDWEILEESDGRKLRLIWTEAGGPPVTAPVQRGFGSRLIERSARDQLGGEATVDFLPRGVIYTVSCALDREE